MARYSRSVAVGLYCGGHGQRPLGSESENKTNVLEVEENRRRDKDREINQRTMTNLQELQDRLKTEIDGRRRNRTENQETIRICLTSSPIRVFHGPLSGDFKSP